MTEHPHDKRQIRAESQSTEAQSTAGTFAGLVFLLCFVILMVMGTVKIGFLLFA